MRLALVLLLAATAAACHRGPAASPRPDGGDGGAAPVIPTENAKPGTPGWSQVDTPSNHHEIEGYIDRVSAQAGDTLAIKISGQPGHSATYRVYRLGWYSGAGARELQSGSLKLSQQAACPLDAASGKIACAWDTTLNIQVEAGWVSGLYLVKLVRGDGFTAFIPFVVRDARAADLLFQASVLTYQAYNNWDGESLYQDDSGDTGGRMATAVSFDRPYRQDRGAGEVLRYEARFAAFLERYGYDVTYTTNLDVSREGAAHIERARAFLSVGHDEYWSGEERAAVQAALDAGRSALFFGANAAYWKVRLSDPGPDGNARTVICYKQHPEADPVQGEGATGRFRDPPINAPEAALVGLTYESWTQFGQPWVVTDPKSPLYEGTGLAGGDSIPGIVGYEYDRAFPGESPSDLQLIAASPLIDSEGRPSAAQSGYYRSTNNAFVFAAGSIYWSYGLDGDLRDWRVERITANVLHQALDLSVPDAIGNTTKAAIAPPSYAQPNLVARTLAQGAPLDGPAGLAQGPDGTLYIADARANRIFALRDRQPPAVVAGDGHGSSSTLFDNVPAAQARFFGPSSIAVDSSGNIYVADTHNHAIRVVTNESPHMVHTLAGSMGRSGFVEGPAAQARFSKPMGLYYDAARNRLLVADAGNRRLREIDLVKKSVTTVAGGGALVKDGPALSAGLEFPTAITADAAGNVYFIDSSVGTIRSLQNGMVSTVAGGGLGFADGPGDQARLLPQAGIALRNGQVVFADPGNRRVRVATLGKTLAAAVVETLAGSGEVKSNDGPAATAGLGLPLGMVATPDGRVIVLDGANARVVELY